MRTVVKLFTAHTPPVAVEINEHQSVRWKVVKESYQKMMEPLIPKSDTKRTKYKKER